MSGTHNQDARFSGKWIPIRFDNLVVMENMPERLEKLTFPGRVFQDKVTGRKGVFSKPEVIKCGLLADPADPKSVKFHEPERWWVWWEGTDGMLHRQKTDVFSNKVVAKRFQLLPQLHMAMGRPELMQKIPGVQLVKVNSKGEKLEPVPALPPRLPPPHDKKKFRGKTYRRHVVNHKMSSVHHDDRPATSLLILGFPVETEEEWAQRRAAEKAAAELEALKPKKKARTAPRKKATVTTATIGAAIATAAPKPVPATSKASNAVAVPRNAKQGARTAAAQPAAGVQAAEVADPFSSAGLKQKRKGDTFGDVQPIPLDLQEPGVTAAAAQQGVSAAQARGEDKLGSEELQHAEDATVKGQAGARNSKGRAKTGAALVTAVGRNSNRRGKAKGGAVTADVASEPAAGAAGSSQGRSCAASCRDGVPTEDDLANEPGEDSEAAPEGTVVPVVVGRHCVMNQAYEAGGQPGIRAQTLKTDMGSFQVPPSLLCNAGDTRLTDEAYYSNMDAEYLVQGIVAHRSRGGKGKSSKVHSLEFMVKWQGYELDTDSWTTYKDLQDAALLTSYIDLHKL